MICACTHRDCWFMFETGGATLPDRCPDCGKATVRPAKPVEIAWYIREHGSTESTGD